MKIKLKKSQWLVVVIILSIFVTGGCSKPKNKYEIYENRNVPACGVNDPLQNIEWLRKYCISVKEKKDVSSVYISLYKVINEDKHLFRISIPSGIDFAPNEYFSDLYYIDCSRDTLFSWCTVTPPSPWYEDFLKDKEHIADLFHFIKQ